MKKSILVLALILAANIAYAEDRVKLTMKNGNEVTGYYELSGDHYCTYMNGGTVCINKSDIAKVAPYGGEELNKVVDVEEQKRLLKYRNFSFKRKEVNYASETRRGTQSTRK
ncbi:MAG: hypothetical protein C0402_16270 [Thermodesulfovibrio sp.]|nr:hypothetical protein [Thermodesulfovibrio sp.]